MHNNEQMIKPEKDSKVEKPHLLLPLNRKRKKNCNPKLLIYPPHLRTAATLSWGKFSASKTNNTIELLQRGTPIHSYGLVASEYNII